MTNSNTVLVSLDIETECGVGCVDKCDHALDEHRNRITVVGVYYEHEGKSVANIYRSVDSLRDGLRDLGNFSFVAHNGKFDLKTLAAKGFDLSDKWSADTLLMASTLTTKVSEEYLRWYATERKRLNALLPKGKGHREGSLHSLKTLAPFFLGVAPFWETPESHDNDEYVLLDCEYTYKLYFKLKEMLDAEGGYEFYQEKLLPWTGMLLMAERRGIHLDMAALDEAANEAAKQAAEAKRQLDEMWAPAFGAYAALERKELGAKYSVLYEKAAGKAKDKVKCKLRYDSLLEDAAKKIGTFNLDSPTQMTWLLRDFLKLDITDFDGDETTGKTVLERLAGSGRADISAFLKYRKGTKLSTAFVPSYKALQVDNTIHCSFNAAGTRTGRLSCAGPNLQQVERDLKRIFIARPGHLMCTYDMSAIEPRLVAYYSHDLNLYDILSQGKDFHNYNTSIFFGVDLDTPNFKTKYKKEREVGKEVALALMYGAGVKRLMESAQKRGFIWSMKEARYKLDRFKEFYEGVYKFKNEIIDPALSAGETITNILGRPLRFDDPTEVYMKGFNKLIQGGASDLVLHSGLKAKDQAASMGIDAHILVFEHDAIISEVAESQAPQWEKLLVASMTNYTLTTPLGPIALTAEGSIAKCWTK